ncbi:hypothetical protein EDB97_106366, partial [Agrobacterium tumefaciens]
ELPISRNGDVLLAPGLNNFKQNSGVRGI